MKGEAKAKEKRYRELHYSRMVLLFAGVLTEKENERIKTKIDKGAVQNGIVPYPKRFTQI